MSSLSGFRRLPSIVLLRAGFIGLLAVGLVSGLTACGKKAGRVDPPPEVEIDQFPRVYPAPALDPKPTYDPQSQDQNNQNHKSQTGASLPK